MKNLVIVLILYIGFVVTALFLGYAYVRQQQMKQNESDFQGSNAFYNNAANSNGKVTSYTSTNIVNDGYQAGSDTVNNNTANSTNSNAYNTSSQDAENDYWTRNNIRQLVGGVEYYFFKNKKLPDSLNQVIDENQFYSDAIIYNLPSKNTFSYLLTGSTTFKVCVEFDSTYTGSNSTGYQYYNRQMTFKEVSHIQGVNCYSYDLATIPITVY